jgi:hypothetical protein
VDDGDGPLELDTESAEYLPIFASLGLVWRFWYTAFNRARHGDVAMAQPHGNQIY